MSRYNSYSYHDMTSPNIISHPERWTSPAGMLNPYNPLHQKKESEEYTSWSIQPSIEKHEDIQISIPILGITFVIVCFLIFIGFITREEENNGKTNRSR